MTRTDDDAERRRRALYRPGADAEEVRRYLEARPPVTVAAPTEQAGPVAPTAPGPALDAGRSGRQALAAVLAVLVLLALPAATAPLRLAALPVPRSGDFSAAQSVTIPPGARSAALAGRATLWSAIAATAPFASRGGTESSSGNGTGTWRRGIDPVPLAASSHRVVTLFVACEGTAAQVGLGSEAEDFGGTSAFSLNDVRVPCGGVRMVRYRSPTGFVPTSIGVTLPAGGRFAVSVVGGF